MISFRGIVADPLRLGREIRFYNIVGDKLIGIGYDDRVDYIIDTSQGTLYVTQLEGRSHPAYRFYPTGKSEWTMSIEDVQEEDVYLIGECDRQREDEDFIVLDQVVRSFIASIPLGTAHTQLNEVDLKAEAPDLDIIPAVDAPYDYEWLIDGDRVKLEDFVLELQKRLSE